MQVFSQPDVPRPLNEELRLAELHKYKLLDSESEPDFDLLAEIAADICEAPYAFISLVDKDRVWFKAKSGSSITELARNDDYCSWAILEDRILHVPDLTKDARMANLSKTLREPYYRMYCGATLITKTGYRVGTLCVLDTRPRELSQRQQDKLVRLAAHVVTVMEGRLRDIELRAAVDDLNRLATRDELTGLLNRRALTQILEQEVQRSRRFQTALSVLMIDIDHFTKVNDTYGHAVGDIVLRGVADVVQAGVRGIDFAARFGGEELCIVLPGTDEAGAQRLAESLRHAVASALFRDAAESVRVTVSIGVAALASDANAMIGTADLALYEAKARGRNRVVVGHST
ncbi:hypothetical protein os4_38780 (plasmid) [Comamonadaceae bacterium OS-4]|nr:hypothetical protein os4_38780 [Comamonadaceae bacterium OS-4]